jgi:hypothetical protein
VPDLKNSFESIASTFDEIRDDFKSKVQLAEFKPISFALNSNKKASDIKIKSFAPQKTS